MTLSGSNTYTGTSAVQAGTLRLLGNAAQAPVLTGGGADIQGGKLTLDYSGGGTDPADQVSSILHAGFAQAVKFSTGQIRTSNPADATKGLGWRDITGSSQVIVAYTYYGDANVDGKVNALDFNAVATNFGAAGGKIWSQGDFNYDGFVNTLDFNSLAANFNQSIAIPAAPALGTLVPEPASVALLAGLMCLTRRRARRHQL
jgi:autotransporter-associated beta strand protein